MKKSMGKRDRVCNAPHLGRPIEAATPEIINKIHDIILTDRVKMHELVEAIGISHGTVISILHEQLGTKKLSARWVPRLLIVDHKRDCVTITKQCLEMFQRNPDKFLRRFITVDETWIHYFTSEAKEQSKQWTSPDEPALKKAKTVKSTGEMMAIVFLECTRYNSYRLPSVEANDQWRLLRSLIELFQQHFKEKTSPFDEEESVLPSRQCTGSYGIDGQIQRIPLRIASPSIIFARFNPLRLFPVSKPEEMVQRKEIHYQRAHHRNRNLF